MYCHPNKVLLNYLLLKMCFIVVRNLFSMFFCFCFCFADMKEFSFFSYWFDHGYEVVLLILQLISQRKISRFTAPKTFSISSRPNNHRKKWSLFKNFNTTFINSPSSPPKLTARRTTKSSFFFNSSMLIRPAINKPCNM